MIVFLSQLLECWDDRHAPLCPAFLIILKALTMHFCELPDPNSVGQVSKLESQGRTDVLKQLFCLLHCVLITEIKFANEKELTHESLLIELLVIAKTCIHSNIWTDVPPDNKYPSLA